MLTVIRGVLGQGLGRTSNSGTGILQAVLSFPFPCCGTYRKYHRADKDSEEPVADKLSKSAAALIMSSRRELERQGRHFLIGFKAAVIGATKTVRADVLGRSFILVLIHEPRRNALAAVLPKESTAQM